MEIVDAPEQGVAGHENPPPTNAKFPPTWAITLEKFSATITLAKKIEKFKPKYTTQLRRKYDILYKIAEVLEVSHHCLRNRLNISKKIDGFDIDHGDFYCLGDFLRDQKIFELATVKIEVDSKGYYTDSLDQIWCTIGGFYKSLPPEIKEKTSETAIRNRISHINIPSARARTGNQKINNIYLETDLKEKVLSSILNPIKVDETGFFTDKEGLFGKPGESYAERKTWKKEKGVKNHALNKGAETTFGGWEKVPAITAKGRGGRLNCVLYSKATINQILSYILNAKNKIINGECEVETAQDPSALQEVTAATREFIKRVYVTITRLGREVPISLISINKRLREKECPVTTGIDRQTGEELLIFDLEKAREIFAAQIRVVVKTAETGDVRENGDRYLTIKRFLDEHPEIIQSVLYRKTKKDNGLIKLKRRDPGNNRIVALFKERDLKRVAGI